MPFQMYMDVCAGKHLYWHPTVYDGCACVCVCMRGSEESPNGLKCTQMDQQRKNYLVNVNANANYNENLKHIKLSAESYYKWQFFLHLHYNSELDDSLDNSHSYLTRKKCDGILIFLTQTNQSIYLLRASWTNQFNHRAICEQNEFIWIRNILSCFLIIFANSMNQKHMENRRKKHIIPTSDCSAFDFLTTVWQLTAQKLSLIHIYTSQWLALFVVCGNIRIIFFGLRLKSVCLFCFRCLYNNTLFTCWLVSCCYYIIHCLARRRRKMKK